MASWGADQLRDLVVRTLLGESDRSPEGMVSVAHVMKNRADSGAWGQRGLTRTITAPKQFSMWNTGDPKLEALAASVRGIPETSPLYQRAAAIADGVFGGQIPDPTNGATHYHTPAVSPDWSQGVRPVATIGGHYFYKLSLNAGNTAGSVDTHAPPPTVQTSPAGGPPDTDAAGARQYLASLSEHAGRAGDTANINPVFATQLASAIKQARAEGLPVGVMSGYRDDQTTGSAYDAGGNSSHGYGLASDISGLDGPNGKITQRWAQIAAANGLHNPYGVDNKAEFNHWQLPEKPLEQTPQLLVALKTARASGDWRSVWSAYDGASPESKIPTRQTYPPVAGVNPNAPASQSQPVAATAPPGSPPTPGGGQSPPAGFVGPGSDKYSLVQGMTTGTSHNPQITTAANWGNLFGGAAPVAPPATPAAAAAPAPQPAPAPKPDSPLESIRPAWGANQPNDPWSAPEGVHPWAMPGAGVHEEPAMTEGTPSMGYPAMSNPFGNALPPPAQTSSLPGSMMASAQNLMKLLFPTG